MAPLNSNFSTEIDFSCINRLFQKAIDENRTSLFENEVYELLDSTGGLRAPVCQFVAKGCEVSDQQLTHFNGDYVVLKIISDSIIHKTEVAGVKVIANNGETINNSISAMMDDFENDIHGILIVEFVPVNKTSVGKELLIGIRNTREFGMTISTGLGGIDTEVFAAGFTRGQSIVSASVTMNSGESFLKSFKNTQAYKLISGNTRGRKSLIDDGLLTSCFDTLIRLAEYYSPTNPNAPFIMEELEINPLAIYEKTLVPLDGLCRFSLAKTVQNPRPIKKIDKLLHPSSIGIIGVSAEKMNFGRIILSNLIASGYDKSSITIIKPDCDVIDGVKCIENLSALKHKLDLFIVAVGADAVFGLVDEMIATDSVESVMLIPGGLGETEASRKRAQEMSIKINTAHATKGGGPIFLGGNCLGVVSHPGGYDSWFIPKEKLPLEQKKENRNAAFVSQSGAFMITRLSQNPWFDPAYMTALGNQNDLTHSDMLNYFVDNKQVDVMGFYIEGFNDLDGLAFSKAVKKAVHKGKMVVVYKAGRSSAGQMAAMGHTASIAGDYDICNELLRQSGAICCNSISEFNDVFYLATMLHDKTIGGNRLAAVSGAGFETVAMADCIHIDNMSMQMAQLSAKTTERLQEILAAKRLDALMEVRNPFDINPGADDEAHLLCTEAMCNDPDVDAVVVGLDPLSPMMRTMVKSNRPGFDIYSEASIAQAMPKLVASHAKPIIGVMDGGELYTAAIETLRNSGVIVFRSCDRAVAALVKYTDARLKAQQINLK